MKTVTLLKTLTIVMGLVILTGTALVGYKLTDLKQKSKPVEVVQADISLVFPENITDVEPCGDKLCLMTVGHKQGRRLLIVDPETGRLSSVLTFNDRP